MIIKKILVGILSIAVVHFASAQDEKMINISLVGGITPNLYNSVTNPLNIVIHVDYNITDNISAGLFYQSSSGQTKLSFNKTFSNSMSEVDNFTETAITQIGAAGIYRYNTSGTFFRPYAMLLAGNTSIQQLVDQTNSPFSELSQSGFEDFSQQLVVDNSYFTFGLGVGAEIKLVRSFGAVIQIAHYDILGLIGDEAQLIATKKDEFFFYDITNGYLSMDHPISTLKYTPIYVNIGFYVKFLKKKI